MSHPTVHDLFPITEMPPPIACCSERHHRGYKVTTGLTVEVLLVDVECCFVSSVGDLMQLWGRYAPGRDDPTSASLIVVASPALAWFTALASLVGWPP